MPVFAFARPRRRTLPCLAHGIAAATAIGALFGLAPAGNAVASPQTITNDQVWHDRVGNEIRSQGGGMIKVGDTYYWYGYTMDSHVSCYSSKDLVNWVFEGHALERDGWLGRPDVAYNAATKKYVMIIEGANGAGRNIPAYFTSDTPTGPFNWVRAEQNVFGYSMGDHSVFKDSDGRAYLVYTFDRGGQNGSMGIAELNSDYLSLKSQVATFYNGNGSCEAGNMVKANGTYYLFSSGCQWWDSSATMYRSSPDLVHWSNVQRLNTAPYSWNSFNTQTDFVITVSGSAGTSYIYAGDRYSEYTGKGVGLNAWYPLTFDGWGTPTLHGLTSWSIDAESGSWYGN